MKRRFADLVDLEKFAAMMQSFYETTGIPYGLIDTDDTILGGIGWQDICVDFHRRNATSLARCRESDHYIASHLQDGPFVGYRCANGLMDYAAPVVIDGEHVATLFLGQLFHEPPDVDAFRRQAAECGFDQPAYLAALAKVPILPRAKVEAAMAFFAKMADMLAKSGIERLRHLEARDEVMKLNATLEQRVEARSAELALAEQHFQATFEQAAIGLVHVGFDGRLLRFNDRFCEFLGRGQDDLAGLAWPDVVHPDDANRSRAALVPVLSGETASARVEMRCIRKNGEPVWARATTALQRDRSGAGLHLITAVEDIDDRKRTEALLEARVRLAGMPAAGSLHDLLVATLDEACALTASDIGFLHFLLPDQVTLSLQAWSTRTTRDYCQAEGEGLHYDVDAAGVWADAVRLRRPVVYNDYPSMAERKGLPPGHAEVRRLISAPIFRDGRIVAVIGVGNKATEFRPKDMQVVETLADLAWDLAERKRAEEALAERTELVQRRYESLRALGEIAALPPGGADRQLSQALALGAGHLGLPFGIISRIRGDHYTVIHHSAPPDAGFSDGQSFALGDTYCAITLQARDVVAIAHVERSEHAGHPCHRASGLEAYIGAPVRVGGRPFGTVNFSSIQPYPREFDDGDLEFMRLLARWVGSVLERRQAENEIVAANTRLTREAARYQLLLATSGDGIHIMDGDGRLIEANESFRRMLGYAAGEMDGFHMRDWEALLTEEGIRDKVSALMAAPARFETRHRCKDGRLLDVEISARSLEFEGKRYVYAASRDVTERKALEADLMRSNAELEQFAYVASHDLREPLRMISSFLSLLRRRLGDGLDDECRQFIDFATDGARRMDHLILDLLDYSRIGRDRRARERVDLAEAAADALDNLRLAIDKAGGRVEIGELPVVTGDRVELVRLFQNLLGNALKYRSAERPPVVGIHARRDGGTWAVTVADNGIGIAPESFDRVFGLFQRLHSQQEYEGTGIGLAACRKIVEHHGGRIWVDSTPGQGSAFTFTLPAPA